MGLKNEALETVILRQNVSSHSAIGFHIIFFNPIGKCLRQEDKGRAIELEYELSIIMVEVDYKLSNGFALLLLQGVWCKTVH